MSAEQILVSVRFRGYYLELLVAKNSTINELVQAMRDNSFIPSNISNYKLIFKKGSGEEVQGNMKVTSIIQKNDNTMHSLVVQVKPQSSLSQEGGTDFFQSQTNKLLERIIKYLKSGSIETLLKAKDNPKLQATMAGHLTTIGQIFLNQKNQIELYAAGLKGLPQYQDNNMSELSNQFADKVKSENLSIFNDLLSEAIKGLKDRVNKVKGQLQKIMKDIIDEKEDQLDFVKKQLSKQKLNVQKMNNEIKEMSQKMQELTLQLKTITEQLIKTKSFLQKTKSQHEISKTFGDQLTIQLKEQTDLVFTKEKQLMKTNNKLKQLQQKIATKDQIIKQKDEDLKQRDEEIKRIKESGIDEQIGRFYTQLEQGSLEEKGPAQGRLSDIIHEKELVDQLRFAIQTEMKKPITQMQQLLSYDRYSHQNYVLNRNFQTIIHQKRSLLLIAIPEGQPNKFFGSFTQQKYTQFPTSYFLPDFNGRSFLFSSIKKQIKYFNIRDGQNSMMFDLENLVFGNDDLIVDFEKGTCKSKFVEGRSIAYNIEPAVKGKDSQEDYKFLLSDSEKRGKQQQEVKLVRYKIYEVNFNDDSKGK